MSITIKRNNIVGETIYINKLSNGVKCYIIPKSDYIEKMAVIGFKYGSKDTSFYLNNKTIDTPIGTAHFIEHTLFEKFNGNIFEKFSNKGAIANAFTDSIKTAYYFTCKSNFEENFETLIDFVQTPEFNKKATEKERNIIEQEINMYKDNASWQSYFNMLNSMYKRGGIKYEIAGTCKSISEINVDIQNMCYDSFYNTENMYIVAVGDIDANKLCHIVEKNIKMKDNKSTKRVYEDNNFEDIVESYVEKRLEINRPVFSLGFKMKSGEADINTIYGMRIAMDYIAGSSSKLFNKLYERGIVDDEISMQYQQGEGFSYSVFEGSGDEPIIIADEIFSEINSINENGIDENRLNILRNKHTGRFIRGFNSINSIAVSQLDVAMKGFDIFDGFEVMKNITPEQIEKIIKEGFNTSNAVLSVIRGK